jgi:hypothetical protein
MGGDLLVSMKAVDRLPPPVHVDALADEPTRHRIAVCCQTHRIVFRDNPRHPRLVLKAGLFRQRDQVVTVSRTSRAVWINGDGTL